MVLEAGVVELPLYSRNYSVSQLRAVFQNEMCGEVSSCSACVRWKNLTLTETKAGGCGTIAFKCFGITYKEQSLGCFQDDNVVPHCFGTCPKSCNFQGTCDKGVCVCDSDWAGDDCSKPNICLNNCTGHGRCKNAECHCDATYKGADCSVYLGQSTGGSDGGHETGSSAGKSGPPVAVFVAVPLGIIAVAGVAGGVFWYLKKKRTAPEGAFHQLECQEPRSWWA